MKVKDIDKLMEQLCFDKREAFSKHEVWLMLSEHNTKVPTVDIVPKGHWIPVSERLPDKNGWYLVTIRGYEIVTDVSLYSADGSAWGDVSTKQKVIAWMPLPEPWKGANE